jgi:hypothetical protein
VSARRLAVLVASATVLGVLGLPGSASALGPATAPPHPTCSPGPTDCGDWHNSDVTVRWAPPPSDVEWTVGCNTVTITNDTPLPGASVNCEWWNADGHTERSAWVLRDATAPSASAIAERGPDNNGWYNRKLTVDFSGTDNLSGIAGCTATRTYTGPDSGVAAVTGTCTDRAGNSRSATYTFQYDSTPPSATARPDRQPDRKGWYNRKVTVDFLGSDATSGIASCAPSVTYSGPDSSGAALSGTCTDRAANTSSAAQIELRLDTRPPVLARLKAKARPKSILLEWRASDDASSFSVIRRPGLDGAKWSTIYTGPKKSFVDARVVAGVRYRYTVAASDDAGNEAVKGARVRAVGGSPAASKRTAARPALTGPLNGARLAVPPLLSWTEVPKATYYNVQLFRDGKKILTAWPAGESLRLARVWKFDGKRQRLSPGRYRWYVWPGYGPRSQSRYGKLLGTRTFVVTRG